MKKRLILCAVIFTLFSFPAFSEGKGEWLEFAVGNGKIEDSSRMSMVWQYTKRLNNNLFSIRWLSIVRPFSEARSDRASEFGVLYGRVLLRHKNDFMVSVSGGIAYTSVKDEWETKKTIGFPLEAKLSFQALRYVGLSFSVFTNINFANSFSGVQVGIQVGKFY